MLGNSDFAKMVTSGGAGLGKDDKVRFDLKQVSQWDRQNQKSISKRKGGSSVGKHKFGKSAANDSIEGGDDTKYRDRALERRKELNNESIQEFEEIVAKLDAEQTKFLGGDVEHTHLVKGLDYALLQKIRGEKHSDDKQPHDLNAATEKEDKTCRGRPGTVLARDISVSTGLGASLRNIIFSSSNHAVSFNVDDIKRSAIDQNDTSHQESHPHAPVRATLKVPTGLKTKASLPFQLFGATGVRSRVGLKAPGTGTGTGVGNAFGNRSVTAVRGVVGGAAACAASVVSTKAKELQQQQHILSRTFFEFDVNPESENDVPLIVAKSRKEATVSDEYVNFVLDSSLMLQLRGLFISGKLLSKHRRKRLREKQLHKSATYPSGSGSGGGGGGASRAEGGGGQTGGDTTSSGGGAMKKKPDDFDNIYGEDIVVGKYVPVGALEEGEEPEFQSVGNTAHGSITEASTVNAMNASAAVTGSSSSSSVSFSSGLQSGFGPAVPSAGTKFAPTAVGDTTTADKRVVKDLFSELFGRHNNSSTSSDGRDGTQGFEAAAGVTGSSSSKGAAGEGDLMKPVRALLVAQAARERAKLMAPCGGGGGGGGGSAIPQQRQQQLQMDVELDEKGKPRVQHRDIFASTTGKVVKAATSLQMGSKLGDSFGLHGTYDDYFVTNYDSDGEDDIGPGKKAKLSAAAGGDATTTGTASSANIYDDDD